MAPGNRSSGLDFSDGKVPSLDQHPDMDRPLGGQNVYLQRNKTERRRLQGLQRSNTSASIKVAPYVPKTLGEKWNVWMINEGGRRMFFFVWIFLHILVAVFGAFHYQTKDNLTTARATFGVTFSAYYTVYQYIIVINTSNLPLSHRPYRCPRPPCRRYIYSFARLPQFHLALASHPSEPLHSLR